MTPPPKDVNCRRLRGFRLDVCRDEEGNPNGLCENCTYAPSTHVFNIGATQHHLCAKCFAEMLMCFVGESVGHPVAQSAKDEEKHDAKAKATPPQQKEEHPAPPAKEAEPQKCHPCVDWHGCHCFNDNVTYGERGERIGSFSPYICMCDTRCKYYKPDTSRPKIWETKNRTAESERK